jgi:hypothetical protein
MVRCLGKWIIFYDKPDLDENWHLAKKLFKNGELEGVIGMKRYWHEMLYRNGRCFFLL